MTRADEAIELAAEILQKREELAVLEQRFDLLMGGGPPRDRRGRIDSRGTTRPGRRSRKEASAAATAPSGEPPSPPAAKVPVDFRRKPDPIRDQIVALAKEGLARSEIAAKLGLKGRQGVIRVSNHLARARRAGDLPKAGAPR